MKCMLCGEIMICVNDYYCWGINKDILACPKCRSGMEVVSNDDGFINSALFVRDYKFSEFETKMLEEKIKKRNKYN